MSTQARVAVRFPSGATWCAAWHYPSRSGGCVVMAGGLAVTKEPGTDAFAVQFSEAGLGVLAFDHRHLGASGGAPRQITPVRSQLEDWRAALAFAATLPGVDPRRLAAWGFSVSGGHVLKIAAEHPALAAVVAQTPNVDGLAAARNAARHTTRSALLRLTVRGLVDTVAGRLGAEPALVPLVGPPGSVALLSTPDALAGSEQALPAERYPDWTQAVAARSVLPLAAYRPGRLAAKVRCPLLVVVADDDRSAPPGPAVRAAAAAPRGEVLHVEGGHYAPFLAAHEQVVQAEVAFLRRHLEAPLPGSRPTEGA